MSTLDDAKMVSLKDKILAQAERAIEKVEESDIESRKGKGSRIRSKSKSK